MAVTVDMPKLSGEQRRLRARAAVLKRDGHPAEAEELKRDLRASRLEDHIRQVVAAAPPLTAEQKDHLRSLLAG